MFEYPTNDIITVHNYGTHVDKSLEMNKTISEREYIYILLVLNHLENSHHIKQMI